MSAGRVDFADPEQLAILLLDHLHSVATMQRFAPGAAGEMGLRIGGTVFVLNMRVARPDEVPA